MNQDIYQAQLSYVVAQRRLFAGLIAILLLLLFLQSILLFFKREKTILLPPGSREGYWIEGSRFSKSYLEEMAVFFCHMLLDVTESSVLPQGDIVLRYVWPASYGEFKQKLFRDQQRLKKEQLSLHFTPQVLTQQGPFLWEVQGLLHTYVGAKKISEIQESYSIRFKQHQGYLFLEQFQVAQTERGGEDE